MQWLEVLKRLSDVFPVWPCSHLALLLSMNCPLFLLIPLKQHFDFRERIWARKQSLSYYFDVKRIASAWNCFGNSKGYHITYSSNLLAALHEALAEICEEGLEKRFKRHRDCAELLWPALENLGVELCVKKPENRFVSVTTCIMPADINRFVLAGHLLDKYFKKKAINKY